MSSHQVEHIVSRKHHGRAILENLAWACMTCNLAKGPEIAGIDPETGMASRLFNPRIDRWNAHFRLQAGRIEGLTLEGRVTVCVLQLNREDLVEQRRFLSAQGRYGS